MGKLKPSLLLLLGLTSLAAAEPVTVGASLQFVSEVSAIRPGVPFAVALHIQHQEGFHTYWKAPGIVGVPTSIEWKLPKGFQAGPIQWPAPSLVEMATHPAHGFHREVLLLVEITPPKKVLAESVVLTGDLTWMACSNTCHPGFAARSISLPINRTAKTKANAKWVRRIDKERRNLPAPSNGWTVTVESKPGASPIQVRVRPAAGTTADPGECYFFSEDGQISSEPPQKARRLKDGSYLIDAERSEWGPKGRTTLPGVVVASGSWRAGDALPAIRVNPGYPEER
jgi:thiol:disulfide interchange protein DsbD